MAAKEAAVVLSPVALEEVPLPPPDGLTTKVLPPVTPTLAAEIIKNIHENIKEHNLRSIPLTMTNMWLQDQTNVNDIARV